MINDNVIANKPSLYIYEMNLPSGPSLWTFPLDLPSGPSLWTFPLDLPSGPSLWTFPLDLPSGPSLWTFPLDLPSGPSGRRKRRRRPAGTAPAHEALRAPPRLRQLGSIIKIFLGGAPTLQIEGGFFPTAKILPKPQKFFFWGKRLGNLLSMVSFV